MIAVDKNVATFIVLLLKTAQVNIARYAFMIRVYPRLRYETFLLKRRMGGISKKHLNMAEDVILSAKMKEEEKENRL